MNELQTHSEIRRYLNGDINYLDLEENILDDIWEQEHPHERCPLALQALERIIESCEGDLTEQELRDELEILSQDHWLHNVPDLDEIEKEMSLVEPRGGSEIASADL